MRMFVQGVQAAYGEQCATLNFCRITRRERMIPGLTYVSFDAARLVTVDVAERVK